MGKGALSIRPARNSDCRFIWELRNERGVRDSAFKDDYIPYRRHMGWFKEKMSNSDSYLFIMLKDQRRIGQARLDLTTKYSAEIDIGIVKRQRRKGLGSRAIKQVCSYALKNLGLKKIVAYVRQENISSFKAFEKANFCNEGARHIKNNPAYRMVLK
jgi:RimJ/RimL family protein N-acetyltransferase